MTVTNQQWDSKLTEMISQLEKSWPKNMEKILKEYPHKNEDFYVYTFFKWNTHIIPFNYNVYHQPRRSMPDAFPGTILRRVSPTQGWSKIIWCLPHAEGFRLYENGKVFSNEIVNESIQKYLRGEFEQKEEQYEKIV